LAWSWALRSFSSARAAWARSRHDHGVSNLFQPSSLKKEEEVVGGAVARYLELSDALLVGTEIDFDQFIAIFFLTLNLNSCIKQD
jgi:hypothetical protein